MKVFILSKENIGIAKAEVSALAKSEGQLIENLLILDSDIDCGRLAYAHSVYELLFRCEASRLYEKIAGFDWNPVYRGDYCVRVHGKIDEKKIAGLIWDRLEKPKVNLKHPKTKIVFFKVGNDVFVCLWLCNTDKTYQTRKAHLRPELMPTSLHPKLARACINLTGILHGTFLDPFCGSGGILIEAGLMGYDIKGYDIDSNVLRKCKVNLGHYGLKGFAIENRDGSKLAGKVDVIVTDLPYGKGSKISSDLETLYLNFLKSAYNVTDNLVVIFPQYTSSRVVRDKQMMSLDSGQLIKKSEWHLKEEFSVYVHRSLTRKVCVLKK